MANSDLNSFIAGGLLSVQTRQEIDLEKAVAQLATFPYRKKPFSQRNWGHSLHFLCSYQGKLKPSIAFFLVKLFTTEGQVVLDPFSGVGTIPFEASMAGRKGIGLDINPIAYHNTRAKVNPPALLEALKQVDELDEYIKTAKLRIEVARTADNFITRFYHKKTLNEILLAKQYFIDRRDQDGKLSLLIASTLHILHGNRPYALSRRSHGLTPLAPSGAFVYKSLTKSLRDKVGRSFKKPIPSNFVRGEARMGTVFKMPFKRGSIGAIITSPPFLNSTRFFANNRIRLWFCGWEYQEQNEKRREFLEEQQRKDVMIYSKVFAEFNRVLGDEALCVLHIGVVENIDMVKLLIPLAEGEGFKKVDTVYEDVSNLESHGMTDQGATKLHAFMILRKDHSVG